MAMAKCPPGGPLETLGGYAAKIPPRPQGTGGNEYRAAALGGARGVREVP
jgi:hypothetical protein